MTSRTRPPSDGDVGGVPLVRVPRFRHSGGALPKYYTIKAVAEALDVSARTVRRWIANGDLIVHRVHGVVRIGEGDLRAFLALHREG